MKKNYIIMLVLLVIVIIAISVIIYFNNKDVEIELIDDNINIEYGDKYNIEIEKLIDFNEYKSIDRNKLEIESNLINEENKEYPAVGSYEIIIKYNNQSLKQIIEVVDKTAPIIEVQNIVEIQKGIDLQTFNFDEFIKVTDLSATNKYTINFEKIDALNIGEYSTVITVSDIFNNVTSKEFIIKIFEQETTESKEQEEQSNLEITQNTNNTNNSNKNESVTSQNSNQSSSNSNLNNTEIKEEVAGGQSQNESTAEEKPKEEKPIVEQCTTNNNHSIKVGNVNRWFDSKLSAINYYNGIVADVSTKWEENKIDDETYRKTCPYQYEVFSCAYCGKWTMNLFYR